MTSLVRFSPSAELLRMHREIDRLFDSVLPRRGDGEAETAVWAPRVDLAETEDAYVLHVDAPGMKKEHFKLNWQDDTLTVSGERAWPMEHEKENFVRMERQFGPFYRSFSLPKSVKGNDITATYTDGVLTVHVPKAEESRPRRISIQ